MGLTNRGDLHMRWSQWRAQGFWRWEGVGRDRGYRRRPPSRAGVCSRAWSCSVGTRSEGEKEVMESSPRPSSHPFPAIRKLYWVILAPTRRTELIRASGPTPPCIFSIDLCTYYSFCYIYTSTCVGPTQLQKAREHWALYDAISMYWPDSRAILWFYVPCADIQVYWSWLAW